MKARPEQRLRPDVEIHIEELIVHGLDGAHGAALGDAIAAALADAVGTGSLPVPAGDVAIEHLDAGELRVPPAAPAAVGREVGGAVHRSLAGALGGRS